MPSHTERERRKRKRKRFQETGSFVIQAILISADVADTVAQARKIADKIEKTKKVDITRDEAGRPVTFRFRIRPPGIFKRLRTKVIRPGVSIVGGPLK